LISWFICTIAALIISSKQMNIPQIQTWPQTVTEAKIIQENLRNQVLAEDDFNSIKYVAGVDVGFKDNYTITKAAVAVLSFPDLTLQESTFALMPTTFPYIPGFLSFREIPGILQALAKLTLTPDLIMCDGQGLAHPRRFGLACHLGVLLNLPTIGVAKSLLVGKHDELPPNKGNWTPLIDKDEIIGAVVRSRSNVKPLYVSIGHRISLETAIDYVLKSTSKYRLPETIRLADYLASH
jgi:deoxyribonuclease V